MRFSERYGYKPVREVLQVDSFDQETNNKLWDVICLIKRADGEYTGHSSVSNFNAFFNQVVSDVAERAIDDFSPLYREDDWGEIRLNFEISRASFSQLKDWWYKEFDFGQKMDMLEILCECINGCDEKINSIFKQLVVGCRVVEIEGKKRIMEINSDEELKSIEQAAKETTFIDKAVSQLKNGDYENSIKESMSAVEDVCKRLLGDESENTMRKNLKKIGDKFNYHPAFLEALNKLYGFSSDEVRHGGERISNIGQEEAYFVLITCSAFINYLKEKERNN